MKNLRSPSPAAAIIAAASAFTLWHSPLQATILTFETTPVAAGLSTIPQDYGDLASAISLPSTTGGWQNHYEQGNGWTPRIKVEYSTSRSGVFPDYFNDGGAEWPGVCLLWSGDFRSGQAIGNTTVDPAKAMPVGFEYYFTFSPTVGGRGVVLNSFVLDDKLGYFDSVNNVVEWRVVQGSLTGPVLASGTETLSGGTNVQVDTQLAGSIPAGGPVILVIRRLAGVEDDLAIDNLNFDETGFPTTSYNIGSLGTAADGTNTAGVILDQPGAVTAPADFSSRYASSERTTIPWQAELNPAANKPFTIEFWCRPTASDNDDAPVFNRVSDGDRSGWVFFQRAPATGWNLRMYDGTGSNVGWDLTGGTSTLNAWSQVAAVWTGSAARLYVNGALVSSTNASGKSGIYRASDTAVFSVGSYDTGGSPINGLVDEIAYYPTALTATRILAHYNAAPSRTAGVYSSAVLSDAPALYLQQNPPAISIDRSGLTPRITFTGILASSLNLGTWDDLAVPSPYLVPAPRPAQQFFRVHR